MQLMVQEGAAPEADQDTSPKASGPAQFSPSGLAAADAIAKTAYAADWARMSEAAMLQADSPEGTSQIYTAYSINHVASLQTLYPHRWVGRLSFQTSSGTSGYPPTPFSLPGALLSSGRKIPER